MRPYPELRQDLVISEQNQAGKKIYVVKEPVSGKFFRFVAFQYYVATLLDGKTSLAALKDIVSERLRRPIRVQTLETFVRRLHDYGLLEPYEWTSDFTILPSDGVTAGTQLSDRKSILFYTLPLIDPHRLFDRLYPWCSFCFRRPFIYFSIFWVLLAAWGLMTDWDMYTTQLYAFDPDFSSILSVYMFLVLTLTIHELAHGMACRHYGGRVSKMGFLMLYFQFGAYTDVSDSYLFPKKSSRMVVMLAGMITGILIIATTALMWRVTEETTWVHHTSFIIMAVTGWGVFFNLNPLIKLDGYYILSDWLDIPNLRHKAFKYLRARSRQLLGLYTPEGISTTTRERRIYLSYGTLAAAYSVILIVIITSLISNFVLEYASEIGVIGLMIGIVAMAVQTPSEATPPDDQNTQHTPPDGAKTRAYSFRFIVWIGILIILIASSLLIEIELRISAPFQLRSLERATVRSRIDGQLNQIFVGEGDTVAAGQLIARLDTRSIDAEIRTVGAQIDQARARLAMLELGARPEAIEEARSAVDEARVNLEAIRTRSNRNTALFANDVISEQDRDETVSDLSRSQAAFEQAKSRLDLLQAGTRQEEIDGVNARIRELSSTVEYLLGQQRLSEIVSPLSGIITTRFLKERRGEFVEIGDEICRLIDHRTMAVEMAVPEREVGDIEIGFPIRFKVQGFPSKDFDGVVDAIAPVATLEGERSIVQVRSNVSNESAILKPGMTGISRVYCGPRSIATILFRRIIRYVRTEFWW